MEKKNKIMVLIGIATFLGGVIYGQWYENNYKKMLDANTKIIENIKKRCSLDNETHKKIKETVMAVKDVCDNFEAK